ncbi:hypothetical protein EKI60_01525 [Candidatus Saccharibacteria bacterium]|nr:MAG: hypothetical protein EKI60_01525 [Candidatus Saccharibacteria bacterium]
MKRLFVPLSIAGLIILGILLVVVGSVTDDKKAGSTNTTNVNETKYTEVAPCDVLTQQIADSLLGGASEQEYVPNSSANDTLSVSNCTYTLNTNTELPISPAKIKTAQLYVRAAKSVEGIASNKEQFDTKRPAGAQVVTGYGQAAYWERTTGQLNILKNNNWYIITNGSSAIDTRRVEDATKLADQIVADL